MVVHTRFNKPWVLYRDILELLTTDCPITSFRVIFWEKQNEDASCSVYELLSWFAVQVFSGVNDNLFWPQPHCSTFCL